MQELWQVQDGKCAMSGLPMNWTLHPSAPYDMVIDCIDPVRDLAPGNVRLICHAAATLRRFDLTESVALNVATALVRYRESMAEMAQRLQAHAP